MSQSAPESNRTVSESILIAVPPAVVYAAVADVADMGRWSPECTGADVEESGAPATVGTRFTGRNESAKGRLWSTQCTVTEAVPGERFTFEVRAAGLSVARWSYGFEPEDDGRHTLVTESWVDQRSWLTARLGALTSGVRDFATHNRASMKVTLQRLKEQLEAEHEAV